MGFIIAGTAIILLENERIKIIDKLDIVEVMRMKKDIILILIAVAAILALSLPKPARTVLPLIILVPVVIYLIVDIIKNENREKK